ncbi:hypothetical protein ABIE27_002967 [Paenibacillus sp. 4624]
MPFTTKKRVSWQEWIQSITNISILKMMFDPVLQRWIARK